MLAIYTRLSREDEDSNSIQNQIREGKEFANNNDFKDYKIYDEGSGVSGSLDVEDRPQLKQLMKDIEEGSITTVWFRNQNRLERNTMTFAKFSTLVKTLKCVVYFGDKKEDYSNPASALNSHILSGLNQYQRELQSIQTKKSLLDNAREGKTHGISPYGYTKNQNRIIIVDEEEAKIIKRIYEMSLSGIGTNKIAEILNSENVPTRYNKIGTGTLKTKYNGRIITKQKKDIKWSGNTITRIIKNPMYKGERHLKSGIYKCPDIISPNLWQKAQDNLIANRNTNGKVYKYDYLLKNKITCGKCGRNYYGRSRISKKDHYYTCSSKRLKDLNCGNRSINIEVIEDFIWQRFFADKVLKDIIEDHFKNTSTEDRINEIECEINILNQNISNNKKKRERAIKLAIDEVLSEEDIKSPMRVLKNDLAIYEQKLSKLNGELKSLETINEDKDLMITELSEIKQNSTFEERRTIIKKYLKNISVTYNEKGLEFDNNYWSLYFLVIDFNVPTLKTEFYIIDKNYNSAFEPKKKILIPLSKKFKELEKENLDILKDLMADLIIPNPELVFPYSK